MLRHFEADDQIELAAEIEPGFEIADLDQRRIAGDFDAIEPGAVDAADLDHVTGLQGFEPGADPAADIQYR